MDNRYKILIAGVAILVVLIIVFFSTQVKAQFNRVGNVASTNLSWVQINAPNTSDWQGIQVTNVIPLGTRATVMKQPVRFNTDVNIGYVKSGDTDQNFGWVGVGGTVWANNNFDKATFSIAPYLRGGVKANSGNFQSQNKDYWSYELEPGLVAKLGSVYGLVAYKYGEGFNSDFGSVVNDAVVGAGVNILKNLAVEARYDINRGSYNTDTFNVGLTYKF